MNRELILGNNFKINDVPLKIYVMYNDGNNLQSIVIREMSHTTSQEYQNRFHNRDESL